MVACILILPTCTMYFLCRKILLSVPWKQQLTIMHMDRYINTNFHVSANLLLRWVFAQKCAHMLCICRIIHDTTEGVTFGVVELHFWWRNFRAGKKLWATAVNRCGIKKMWNVKRERGPRGEELPLTRIWSEWISLLWANPILSPCWMDYLPARNKAQNIYNANHNVASVYN